ALSYRIVDFAATAPHFDMPSAACQFSAFALSRSGSAAGPLSQHIDRGGVAPMWNSFTEV
ncbi:MAG: hypothetical protein QOC62_565, partial [Mycobacterium sp.]|nr:hypothetical protein [Mycobacterium sp.]